MKKLLITLLFTIALPLSARASLSAVYISQNGAGSESGADCADAQTFAWSQVGGHWGSGSTQIGVGTAIHLCGTITSNNFFVDGSGTQSQPISIIFEPGASITAPYLSQYGAIQVDGTSWLTVNCQGGSIQATDNGTALDNQVNSIGIALLGGVGYTVENCNINNVYVRTPQAADSTGGASSFDIDAQGASTTIINNHVNNADCNICFTYGTPTSTDVTITGNTEWGSEHGIVLQTGGIDYASMASVTIAYNTWDGGDIWYDTTPGGNAFHRDGIFVFDDSPSDTPGIDRLFIYNNREGPGFFSNFEQTAGTGCVYFDTEGHIGVNQFTNVYIFNNICSTQPGQAYADGWLTLNSLNGAVVANNTLVTGLLASSSRPLTVGGSNLSMYNNLVYNNSMGSEIIDQLYLQPPADGTIALDHNDYNGLAGSSGTLFATTSINNSEVYVNNFFTTLAAWLAGTGWDTHTITSDPLFVNSSVATTTANYHLQTGSPAIQAGVNLTADCSAVSALCYDYDGNARPSVGAWDIGAYQYQAPPPATSIFIPGGVNLFDAILN